MEGASILLGDPNDLPFLGIFLAIIFAPIAMAIGEDWPIVRYIFGALTLVCLVSTAAILLLFY